VPVKKTKSKSTPSKVYPCPVVGIGASAGGVEAFTELFSHLPANTGMAFVVVQHLSQTSENLLGQLIQKVTEMPVVLVNSTVRIIPNSIYVIAAKTHLTVKDFALIPKRFPDDVSHPMTIDHFFYSLADELQAGAIGVVLSGAASDGAMGLKAIKTAGGVTFAQDPKDSKFDGMPHSAIASGAVDFVFSAAKIANELRRIGADPFFSKAMVSQSEDPLPDSESYLPKIFALLRDTSGVDFTYYKPPTIKRRIKRRMILHRIDSLKDYVRFIEKNHSELNELYQDVLINVTRFFRDPESFELLKEKLFPEILVNRSPKDPVRMWVPGCATGEEAYSLAMALVEFLGAMSSNTPIQIFATDVSSRVIDKARHGIYPASIKEEVSPDRLKRFFTKTDRGYRISKAIRDMCVFSIQDVTKDPPFSRLDLISCRNVLIYLGPVLQKRVMSIFHYALKPDGFLVLGSSESIGSYADLFALKYKKSKIYYKKSSIVRNQMNFTGKSVFADNRSTPDVPKELTDDLDREIEKKLLKRYAPAAIVVNEHLEIVYFYGPTGDFINPVAGRATLNLMKMASETLQLELRAALHHARRTLQVVRKERIVFGEGRASQLVNVEVTPMERPGGENCFLLVFEKVQAEPTPAERGPKAKKKKPDSKDEMVKSLKKELLQTREYLQTIISEQDTSNEELQSANEEVMSSNEELQSANEELETAKEELQSTNEEMATVNEELYQRNLELNQLNNDLNNLFLSVEIALIIVGKDLRIRRFTPGAERLMSLISTDVGRLITDIKPKVAISDLDQMINQTIRDALVVTRELRDSNGRPLTVKVRPYRTSENRVDGVVIVIAEGRQN
jgi:two-component system, chemotaxis family, CheB/CheR fusion protein